MVTIGSLRCVTGQSLAATLRRFSGAAETQARKTEINRNRSRGRGGARSRPTGIPTIKIISFSWVYSVLELCVIWDQTESWDRCVCHPYWVAKEPGSG